jgi:predicted kinase
MKEPVLFVFGGLPGSGKTALSRGLSRYFKGVYLRIDTIEQALRNYNSQKVIGEGYAVAYAVAADNLLMGNIVIADSVNPIPLTRDAWRDVALTNSVKIIEIEVICSDKDEHRKRVEIRQADIAGHKIPTWQEVIDREYHSWTTKNITIDTAGKTQPENLKSLIEQVQKLC